VAIAAIAFTCAGLAAGLLAGLAAACVAFFMVVPL
jgi:hypothetical protein